MLVTLIVLLIVVGVALYLVQLIPMDPVIRTLIRVVVILFVVLYALKVLGLLDGLNLP